MKETGETQASGKPNKRLLEAASLATLTKSSKAFWLRVIM